MFKQECMYCGVILYECMGKVLVRDLLPLLEAGLEGKPYTGPQPRQLCWGEECNSKWAKFLEEEASEQEKTTSSDS